MSAYQSLYTQAPFPGKNFTREVLSQVWLSRDQPAIMSALHDIAKAAATGTAPEGPTHARLACLMTGILVIAITQCKKNSMKPVETEQVKAFQRLLPLLLDCLENGQREDDDEEDEKVDDAEQLKRKREDSTFELDHLSGYTASETDTQASSSGSAQHSAKPSAKRNRDKKVLTTESALLPSLPILSSPVQPAPTLALPESNPPATESNVTVVPNQALPAPLTSPASDPPTLSSAQSSSAPALGSLAQLFRDRHIVTPLERQELADQGIFIGDRRGQGGQGSVHVVKIASSSQVQIVKKIIPTKYQASEIAILRLLSENPHEHLASSTQVYYTSFGVVWVLFSSAVGDLRQRVKQNGGFSDEATASIVYDLVTALMHLHRLGVFHRDIKLANAVVTSDGEIKLIDFGLSAIIEEGDIAQSEVGTYPKPPEVTQSSHYQASKGDIYSLGCLGYQARFNRIIPDTRVVLDQEIALLSRSTDFKERAFGDFLNMCLQQKADDRPSIEELYKKSMFLRFGCEREEMMRELGLSVEIESVKGAMPGSWIE